MNSAEAVLIYSDAYSTVPVAYYLAEASLKPKAEQTDKEIEILEHCNGALNQFAQKFWHRVAAQHEPLKQHFNAGDELLSIYYSDRYLYSPWTVILIAELIDGLRRIIKNAWGKLKIHIDCAPKLKNDTQRRGLFADWLDDKLRLDVIEAYFAAMNETSTTKVSNDIQHGRVMQLQWYSGKTTTIRLDQGVGYWCCDTKTPWFDNLASASEQAANMMSLVPRLNVKNHKDFPTQVFVKERK